MKRERKKEGEREKDTEKEKRKKYENFEVIRRCSQQEKKKYYKQSKIGNLIFILLYLSYGQLLSLFS